MFFNGVSFVGKKKSQCSKNSFINAILRKKYNYTLFIYYINNVCKW